MSQQNSYPFILVHGFLCWGSEAGINKVFPLFGMWVGDAKKALETKGYTAATPHVGPFSGMWDRACILYAKIKGGRVDYGKVHSEKGGYPRYGETYPGLVPNWGELDDEGKIQKINLIGHSFGGPTVRTLIHLLAEGSEEERSGTDPDDLSPLFAGGKKEWVHSCVTLAATHNGVTLPVAVPHLANCMAALAYGIGNLVSGTPIARFYDFSMDRFGFTSRTEHIKLQPKKIADLLRKKENNIYWELGTEGGMELTKDYKTYDNIYYFSYNGRRTWTWHGFELPTKKMWFPFYPFSLIEGFYKDKDHGVEWRANDGIVNVESARHPANEPFVEYQEGMEIKPGIWHVMPVEDKDHTSYMGIGEKEQTYNEFFTGIAERICSLPTISL